MAEDRKLVYKVDVDIASAEKKLGELKQRVESMRSDFNKLTDGNIKITENGTDEKLKKTAKGLKDVSDGAENSSAKMQTYTQQLKVVTNAIELLTKKINEGKGSTIEIDGIARTMKDLRALQKQYEDTLKTIKEGSINALEKKVSDAHSDVLKQSIRNAQQGIRELQSEYDKSIKDGSVHSRNWFNARRKEWDEYNKLLKENGKDTKDNPFKQYAEYHRQATGFYDKLAEAQKNYDKIVGASNAKFINGTQLQEYEWHNIRKEIDSASDALKKYGKFADFSNKSKLTDDSYSGYLSSLGKQESFIAAQRKRAVQDIERIKKLNREVTDSEVTGDVMNPKKYLANWREVESLIDNVRKAGLGAPASAYTVKPDEYARGKAALDNIARMVELNRELRDTQMLGEDLSLKKYRANYNEMQKLRRENANNGFTSVPNEYAQTPKEYKAALALKELKKEAEEGAKKILKLNEELRATQILGENMTTRKYLANFREIEKANKLGERAGMTMPPSLYNVTPEQYVRQANQRKAAQQAEANIQRMIKLNNDLRDATDSGAMLGYNRYAKNFREMAGLAKQIQQAGYVAPENKYTQTPKEYQKILEANEAQVKLNRKLIEEQNLVDRINVAISKGKMLNEEEYKIIVRKSEALRAETAELEKQANVKATHPENKLLDNENYNTFGKYSAFMATNAQMTEQKKPEAIRSFRNEINQLRASCESLYRTYQLDPTKENLAKFASTRHALAQTRKEYARYQEQIEGVGGFLAEFSRKAQSHLAWIGSGSAIAVAMATPSLAIDVMQKLEAQMASIRQVIPQIEANPIEAGTDEFEKQNKRQVKAMQEFIDIAKVYGVSIDETMDAARSIGRMYGQGDNGLTNTEIFTKQAAKMSVADAFAMEDATKGLEAAMSQWNLQTEDSNRLMANSQYIIDVWTRAAHSGAASAQDIGQAIEAAGTAAAQAGVSFEFFNALVETGVRSTARSGNEIGQSIKSMMVSMKSDQSIKALKQWGIEVEEIGKDGKKHVRSMEDIIMDVSRVVSTTNTDTQKFLSVLSGGRYQYSKVSAMLKNYKELLRMQGILNDGKTKGFSDKQVQVQLGTVQRQMQQLKTDAENVFVAMGRNGGLNDLKWLVQKLDDLLVGFRQLIDKDGGWTKTWVVRLAEIAAGLKAVQILAKRAIIGYSAVQSYRAAGGTTAVAFGNPWAAFKESNFYKTNAQKGAEIGVALNGGSTEKLKADTDAQEKNNQAHKTSSMIIGSQSVAYKQQGEILVPVTGAANDNAKAADKQGKSAKSAGRSIQTMGVRARATALGVRGLALAESVATSATNLLKGAIAACGGPMGIAVMVLSTLAAEMVFSAMAAGDAANEQQKLTGAMQDEIATADETVRMLDSQEKTAKSLAEQHNKLVDSINSGTLSTEEAARAKENLQTVDETLTSILGEDAQKCWDNDKVSIDMIHQIMDARRTGSTEKIQQTVEDAKMRKAKLQGDASATQKMSENARLRISALKNEVTAVKKSGEAWSALHKIIAQARLAMAENDIKEGTRLLTLADRLDNDSGFDKFKDWAGLGLDRGIQYLWGGTDSIRSTAQELIDRGTNNTTAIIQDMTQHSGDDKYNQKMIDSASSYLDDLADTADAITEKTKKANADAIAACDEIIAQGKTAIDRINHPENYPDTSAQGQPETDPRHYGKDKKGHQKSSHEKKDPKVEYQYSTDTAKAIYNLSKEFNDKGLDVPHLLGLVMALNGTNTIDGIDFADPFKMGSADAWASSWSFRNKLMDLYQAGDSDIAGMIAKIFPSINWKTIEGYVGYMDKGGKTGTFAGWDFEKQAPKSGFRDPYNTYADVGGTAEHNIDAYSNPHIREIADKTAELIRQKTGKIVNADYLYGQMMAEDANNAYHNYAGIGPGETFASDDDFIKRYAREYYIDSDRMRALQAATASEFVQILDNVDANWHPREGAWNADDNQWQYAQTINEYGNEGKLGHSAWEIDLKYLGRAMDNGADGCVEAVTKFGHNCEFLAEELQNGVVRVPSLVGDATAKGIYEAFNASRLERGDVIVYGDQDHVVMYDGNGGYYGNSSRSYDKGNGHTVHGGNFYEMNGLTPTGIIKTGRPSGKTAIAVGNKRVHDWAVESNSLRSFSVSAYEMMQASEQLAQSLHDATKATLDFQQKIRGSFDMQQYDAVILDAQRQEVAANMSYNFWHNARKSSNDNVWRILHNGDNNNTLAALGGADFGQLPESSQTRLAEQSKNKELIAAVKAMQTAKAEEAKAYNKLLETETNRLSVSGYLNKDEYFEAQMKDIEGRYNTMKESGVMYERDADIAMAQEQLALLRRRKMELQQILVLSLQASKAEADNDRKQITMQQMKVEDEEARVKALSEKVAATKAKHNAAPYNQSISNELNAQNTQLERANTELEHQRALLASLIQDEKVKSTLGNKEAQEATQKLREVEAAIQKAEKTVDQVTEGLKQQVVSSTDTMFSDILMQGKSFSESFKNLWRDIGNYALQTLMKIYLNKMLLNAMSFGGGASAGGFGIVTDAFGAYENPQYATGGLLPAFANGGQAGGSIVGAGTGKSDSILAYLANKDRFVYLSNGEYVMTEEATKRIGKGNLDAMNYGKYADGGLLSPTPYVPQLSPKVAGKASGLSHRNPNEKMETLMQEQIRTTKDLQGQGNGGGGLVVLNTQASSEDVLKALQQNPRAVQNILGRQQRYGFR